MLSGGDRRTIGRADEAAKRALSDAAFRAQLVLALDSADLLVRMRAADALEKVTRSQPELLRPYRQGLLGLTMTASQQELRWHLAQMLPRLGLDPSQRKAAVEAFESYLSDKSAIVRAWSLNAIAEIAAQDRRFAALADRLLAEALRSPSAAVRTRAKLILAGRKATVAPHA
jgi:hypothetical protein